MPFDAQATRARLAASCKPQPASRGAFVGPDKCDQCGGPFGREGMTKTSSGVWLCWRCDQGRRPE